MNLHDGSVRSLDAPAPARAHLTRLLMGQAVALALGVVAELGIADLLAGGPRPVGELAAATGVDADALGRLLRALAGEGIFAEPAPGEVALTPLAEFLRDDHPQSARPSAMLWSGEYRRSLGGLRRSLETGRPAFEAAYGQPFFDYLAGHPDRGALFDRNMSGMFAARNQAVVAAYDFAGIETLVDVGGGEGGLLRAILAAHPAVRGILFDRPATIERARARAGEAVRAIGDRFDLVAGDFFAAVPAGADGYLLAGILHDWPDDRAAAILRNVRDAIAVGGRLLVIEEVIPPGNAASYGKWLDLVMLVLLGGRERTEAEFGALLAASGFALTRVVPTASGPCVVEALPV